MAAPGIEGAARCSVVAIESRVPVPPADTVANLRVLERIFEGAVRRLGHDEGTIVRS